MYVCVCFGTGVQACGHASERARVRERERERSPSKFSMQDSCKANSFFPRPLAVANSAKSIY